LSDDVESVAERMRRRELATALTQDEKEAILRMRKTDAAFQMVLDAEDARDKLKNLSLKSLMQGNTRIIQARREEEEKSLRDRLIWIDEAFSKQVPLTTDQLYLFGGMSKNGKSTLSANIVHSLAKQTKKSLVISNEESTTDVLARVACLDVGVNFNKDKLGLTSSSDREKVTRRSLQAAELVHVVGKEQAATYTIEVVKQLLELSLAEDYSVIVLDYFQVVSQSLDNPTLSYYDVLSMLATFLGSFVKRSKAPLVVFAQLKPNTKDGGDFKNRLEHCKSIFNVATHIFELTKDKETRTSVLEAVNSRFAGDVDKFYFKFEAGLLSSTDAPDDGGGPPRSAAAQILAGRSAPDPED
jgi:replicative DNA helicase